MYYQTPSSTIKYHQNYKPDCPIDEMLFSQSYEKIREELSQGEQNLVIIMLETRRREDILGRMDRPGNFEAPHSLWCYF